MNVKRWTVDGAIIALAALFAIAYLALSYATSYQHIYILGAATGQAGADARMTPLVLDLPILVLSLAILLAVRLRAAVPWWLWASLWFGVIATVGANAYFGLQWAWSVHASIQTGVTAALLSAIPACFLAIVVEASMFMLRIAAESREKATVAEKKTDRYQRATQTRKARRGDSEAVQGQSQDALPAPSPWPGQGNPLAPTGAFPQLSGIGMNGRQN